MHDATALIDPTAARFDRRPPAPGLDPAGSPLVALVDGTLNKASHWGRGMLDAAAAALREAVPGARFGWESLDPLANEPPDLWAAGMTDRYDAVVVSAGDCVTCTTRGVRDAIWVEMAGVPAAVVCTEAVDEIVASVCATFGMPDLRVCRISHSLFGLSREQIAALAAADVADLGAALVRRSVTP